MAKKIHEDFRTLIIFSTFSGMYCSFIEKIYPSKRYTKALRLIFIVPAASVIAFTMSMLKAIIFDEKETMRRLQGCGFIIFSAYAAYVVIDFYFSEKSLAQLLELWDSLFQEELFSEKRSEILEKNKTTVMKWFKVFIVSNATSSIVYTLISYFKPSKELDHISGIPYRNASPDYELIVTFELFVTFFGFVTVAAYDTITMVCLALEEAQLKHLQNSLYQIFGILSITESGQIIVDYSQKESENKILRNKNIYETKEIFSYVESTLRVWISHHQQLLRYHDELQKVYHTQMSVKYFIFVLVICFVTFLSITEGGFTFRDSIIAFLYAINSYALFYKNIQFADSINDTAQNIGIIAFSKTWFLYPQKITTAFKIISLQSTRPVQLMTFHIYPLGSRSFRQILSSAYSFFTFLWQVTRKRN